jgi:hypothetical protein
MSITLYRMNGIERRTERVLSINYSKIEAPRPNGLQRFQVGDQVVFALNKKNAERKAKLYPDKEIIGG